MTEILNNPGCTFILGMLTIIAFDAFISLYKKWRA